MDSTKPKYIIFDIGGVLIEYDNTFITAEREQKVQRSVLWSTFDKYTEQITKGKITPNELYQYAITENNLQADPNYNFFQSWLSDYLIIKPTFDLVTRLSQYYPICLFSNIYKDMVPVMIKAGQLPNINYHKLFLSYEMGLQKPEPEAYAYIQNELEANPAELLFIDDRPEYLAPALIAGWQTYLFPRRDPQKGVEALTQFLLKTD